MKTIAADAARTVLRLGALALALAALDACSRHADAPPAPAADTTPYVAVARGKVDVEGGLLNLSMPVEGTLASVDVHEGQQVRQGQLLATLDARPAQLAVDAAQARLEQARAKLKLDGIQQDAAKLRAQRLAAAAAAGAGDGQSADDAREASARLDAEHGIDQAAVAMAQQQLDEAKYALQQRRLAAPLDAEVVRVAAQPGATVAPGAGPLFVLLPDKPRIVRAELNESYVDAVRPGMRAEVEAGDGQGRQRWSARVLRVGQVYGPATLQDDPQVRANARAVECVLALDPPRQLRIGQRVIVRFLPAGAAPKD
jgi:multidrug resistance efflux pump